MDLNTLALFALTEFLLSLTPGPAVLLVIGLSMRQGFRIGFMATLGILSTNAVFFTLSALGIGALIVASATLFTIIKWVGAAYLVYLGVGMVMPLAKRLWQRRSFGGGLDLSEAKAAAPKTPQTAAKSFWQGFALQASNPKNILFFVAILPQFISPDGHWHGFAARVRVLIVNTQKLPKSEWPTSIRDWMTEPSVVSAKKQCVRERCQALRSDSRSTPFRTS